MILYENKYTKLALIENNLVEICIYNNVYDATTILKNIPKSDKARKQLLESIEERANRNARNNKTDYDTQCQDARSLRNRYSRQWRALACLLFGCDQYGEPKTDYDFGDILA